jgi:hypothetical protein
MSYVYMLAFLLLAWYPDPSHRPPSPNFVTPVDYAAYCQDLVEKRDCENAFHVYSLLVDKDGRSKIASPGYDDPVGVDLTNTARGGPVWTTQDKPELAKIINDCEPELKLFERGTATACFWRPLRPGTRLLFDSHSPFYTGCRGVSEVLLADAWRKQEDQVGSLLKAWTTLLRHSSQIQSGKTMLDALCAEMTERAVFRSVLSALARGVIQERAECRRVYESLQIHPSPPADMETIYVIEWATALDELQYLCPGGQPSEVRWKNRVAEVGNLMPWSDSKTFDPQAAAGQINETFQVLIDLSRQPYQSPARAKVRHDGEREIGTTKKGIVGLRDALARYMDMRDRTVATRRGVMLALLICGDREKNGTWVKDLKDLALPAPEYCVDAFTGKSIVYKITDDGPLLYSLGPDGQDDGGKDDMTWAGAANPGDYVFLPATLPYRFTVQQYDE